MGQKADESIMIYFKHLEPEERAIWGVCPVCSAEHGKPCTLKPGAINFYIEEEYKDVFAHVARLFNAPLTAAINRQDEDHDG